MRLPLRRLSVKLGKYCEFIAFAGLDNIAMAVHVRKTRLVEECCGSQQR